MAFKAGAKKGHDMAEQDEKRYQVYGYGDDHEALAGGQVDRGQHDERLHAEAVARDTVRQDGLRAAHVMRCRDGKIVYHFDREEMA